MQAGALFTVSRSNLAQPYLSLQLCFKGTFRHRCIGSFLIDSTLQSLLRHTPLQCTMSITRPIFHGPLVMRLGSMGDT